MTSRFVYDAEGNRIKGTVNGVTTFYIAGSYEYENGASTKYYSGAGGAVAMRRTGYSSDNGIFYPLRDHLGSTSIINRDDTVNKRKYDYYLTRYTENRTNTSSA